MNNAYYENLIRKEKQHLNKLKAHGYVPGIFKMITNTMFNIEHYERVKNKTGEEEKNYSLKGLMDTVARAPVNHTGQVHFARMLDGSVKQIIL